VRVENWGRTAARIAAANLPPSVQMLGGTVVVPAAYDGRPGIGALPLRVLPAKLAPGAHSLPLTFHVECGGAAAAVEEPRQGHRAPQQLRIDLPVDVAAPKPKRSIAPAAVAAVLAVFLLTVVIVLYLRVLS
jgi:hypothetical protein